jgi:WNK lysine deficient protein kinase
MMDNSYHHYNTAKSDQSVDSGIHSPPQHDMSDPISSSAHGDEVEYNNEDTTSSSILTRQLAAQYPEYENYPAQPQYPSGNDVIDRSSQHDTEKVVEVSPNGRYARLNTVLGKGAYKIVYKAIDRDEGYEIAWNVLQVRAHTLNFLFSFHLPFCLLRLL